MEGARCERGPGQPSTKARIYPPLVRPAVCAAATRKACSMPSQRVSTLCTRCRFSLPLLHIAADVRDPFMGGLAMNGMERQTAGGKARKPAGFPLRPTAARGGMKRGAVPPFQVERRDRTEGPHSTRFAV